MTAAKSGWHDQAWGAAAANIGPNHRTPRAVNLAACDGHHEMSDCDAAGEPVHSNGERVEPVWPRARLDDPFSG